MLPLVSVVWNGHEDLGLSEQSIQSVLNQKDAEIELLISQKAYEDLKIRDCDTKGNAIVVLLEKDERVSQYRNSALKRATGKYICFLSSPNQYAPDKTQRQVEYLEQHPDIFALFGGETLTDATGRTLFQPTFVETDPDYIPSVLKYGYEISIDSTIFLLERIIEGNCLFDDSEGRDLCFIKQFADLYPVSGLQGECVKLLGWTEESLANKEKIEVDGAVVEHIKELYAISFSQGWNARLAYRNGLIRSQRDKNEIRRRIDAIGMLRICQSPLPLVSVVIPTYNRGDRVIAAIESVLNQTYDNIEVIVVDDGSTDDTTEILGRYAQKNDKVRYYCLERNGGPANARNFGVQKARGAYIAFHDDDDAWFRDKLDIQMSLMMCDASIDMTFGQMARYEGDSLLNIVLSDFDWYNRKADFFQEELKNNYIGAPTIVMKKEKFDMLSGFCEALFALEDWDFAIRAFKDCKIEYINTPLMEVNVLEKSVTRNTSNNMMTLVHIIEHYYDYAADADAFMMYQRKHLQEMMKLVDQPEIELKKLKNRFDVKCFTPELARKLFFDADDYLVYRRLDALETVTRQQQTDLQRQDDRNNALTAELQRQDDRNWDLTEELRKQDDRNNALTAELQRQDDRNRNLTEELKKQFERNDALTIELQIQYDKNDNLSRIIAASKINGTV